MSSQHFGASGGPTDWTRNIHDIMDEMLNRSFVGFRDRGTWQPATNVYETREHYVVCLELAGMRRAEIAIECRGERTLCVSGRRAEPRRPEDSRQPLSVHVMEIDAGPFAREIELPERIDAEHVEATYHEGFLWLRIPKLTAG